MADGSKLVVLRDPGDIVENSDITSLLLNFFSGSFVEKISTTVTSDGATVSLALENADATNDLTMRFTDGFTVLDVTPALEFALDAGTLSSPTENYVYIPVSSKVLTKDNTDWPSEEHIKVIYAFVESPASVQAEGGPLVHQPWNDGSADTGENGHMLDLAERLRIGGGADWYSGVAGTGTDNYLTITPGSPDTVTVQSGAGVVYQLHRHEFDAQDTSGADNVHVVNHDTTPNVSISDLADLDNDASGGSLSNKWFNVVLWGVANREKSHSPLMLNLPTGTYNTQAAAEADADRLTVFDIPREYFTVSSTGFLIARMLLRKQSAGGGTWTLADTEDLRGSKPGTLAGGGTGGSQVQFPDNQFVLFDETTANELTFQLSALSGNREVTALDTDGVMALSDVALTAESIPFIDANGRLDEDTIFVRDAGTGNIGIGTATPEATAHIVGSADQVQFSVDADFSQTANIVEIRNNIGSVKALLTADHWLGLGKATAGAPIDIEDLSETVLIQYSGLNGSTGEIGVHLSGNGGFMFNAPGALQSVQLQAQGTAVLTASSDGYVGIGDTTPDALLKLAHGSDSVAIKWQLSGSTGSLGVHAHGNGGMFFNAEDALQSIELQTQGNTVLVCSSDGYVGINDATPDFPLDIQVSSGAVGFNLQMPTATLQLGAHSLGSGGVTIDGSNGFSKDMRFRIEGTDVLTMSADFNVGIGTTSPGATAHIVGSADQVQFSVDADSSQSAANIVEIRDDVGADHVVVTAAGQLELANQILIAGGVPGAGKVLTDVGGTGLGTWETPAGGGGSEFADDVFRVQDNSDATKELAYQVDTITTGTTRTVTALDTDGVMALSDAVLPVESIPFVDSVGRLTSSSVFVRDAGTGDIGVGTAAPTAVFHVKRNQDANSILKIDNTSGGTSSRAYFHAESDTGNTIIGAASSGYTGVGYWQDAGFINTSAGLSGGLVLRASNGGIGLSTSGSTTVFDAHLDSNGDLGVGGAPNSSYIAYFTGDVGVTGTLTDGLSDARTKTDVRELDGAQCLQNLMRMRPVDFTFLAQPFVDAGVPPPKPAGERNLGFVAQDIEPLFASAVVERPVGTSQGPLYKNIIHKELLPPVVAATQEIARRAKDLKDQLDTAKARVQTLENQMAQSIVRIQALETA